MTGTPVSLRNGLKALINPMQGSGAPEFSLIGVTFEAQGLAWDTWKSSGRWREDDRISSFDIVAGLHQIEK